MTALLKRLSQTTPPVMPETIARLQALRESQVTRHADIGQVLMDDPAATVAVFRELERTRPGSYEQVADSAHAVSLLGVSRFQQLIDGLPMVETAAEIGREGLAAALARGAHSARFAAALARHLGLTGETEITTAALLQDPLWLALWASAPEQAAQIAMAVRSGTSLPEALQAAIKEPIAELNNTLARSWAMPTLARQAIRPVAGDKRPKLGAVRLADAVATATSAGWQHPMVNTLPEDLAAFLDLEPEAATRWLHEQATDIARELSGYGYPLAGYDLLLLPTEGDDEPADTSTAKVTTETPAATAKAPPAQPPKPVAKPHTAKKRPPGARPNLHDTMVDIMRRIRSETGTSRVLFAMLSADRRHLRTRLVLGGNREDALRRLDIDTGGHHLFAELMKKSQSVWLNTGNKARYDSLLTHPLRETIRPDNAYVMSLFIRGRALGLLYGDGDTLTDAGYQRFRSLCNRATNALSS